MIRQCLAKILLSAAMVFGAAAVNAETALYSEPTRSVESAAANSLITISVITHDAVGVLADPSSQECTHKKKPCQTCISGTQTNLRKSMRGPASEHTRNPVLDWHSLVLVGKRSDTYKFDPAFPAILLSTMRIRI